VKHGNYKIGTPILKYKAPDGTEHFSHVNEKGLYLLAKLRNDDFQTTQKWRNKILNGEMSMYSIAGQPLPPIKEEMQGSTLIRTIVDIEPWEITICEKGVNPKANFKILAKETITQLIIEVNTPMKQEIFDPEESKASDYDDLAKSDLFHEAKTKKG